MSTDHADIDSISLQVLKNSLPLADASACSTVAVTTILSPIQDTYVDGDMIYKWIQLVSGLHVSDVNAALDAQSEHIIIIAISPIGQAYRVAQKTGPPSHFIANILKFHDRIAWKLVNFCSIIC